MILAAIVGIVVGCVSVAPFVFAAKKIARTIDPTAGSLAMLAPLLATVAISFVVLVAGLIACKLIAPDVIVAMAAGEFAAFVIGVIVFGISLSKRR